MLKNKIFIAMIVAVMCMSVVSLSGCKKDKVVLNSQQNNSEGTWFHVKHAGFTTLNKSYEEFKAETLKRGKSGIPYSEETLRELYQQKLESDRWFYDQGFDGYPLQWEILLYELLKKTSITLHLAISDPQIKKEIEFMYQTKSIDKQIYEEWLTLPKSTLFMEYDKEIDGKVVLVQNYLISKNKDAFDGMVIDRKIVQQNMLKNELAISDPQIKKEIDFMWSHKMIDDATYNKWKPLSREELIFTGGLPKMISIGVIEKSEMYVYHYPDEPNGMDGVALERRDLQKMMRSKGI